MPEWEQVTKYQAMKLKPGQKVRAYKGEFNRAEGVITKDEEGDLYAPYIGYLSNQYGEDGLGDWHNKWDKLEVHHLLPTEDGIYVSVSGKTVRVLVKTGRYWSYMGTSYYDSDIIQYLPFEKLMVDPDWEPPIDVPQPKEEEPTVGDD